MQDQQIRFIDSRYNDLFQVPNGGYIQTEFQGNTVLAQCIFVSPYHTQVGGAIYHICEYAERMERLGATYQPEPEILSDQAAWKLGKDMYFAMQECDMGYDFTLMNECFLPVNEGILELPELTMLEARAEIFKLLELSPRELRAVDYETLMDRCFEAGFEAMTPESLPNRTSILEQLTRSPQTPARATHKSSAMER